MTKIAVFSNDTTKIDFLAQWVKDHGLVLIVNEMPDVFTLGTLICEDSLESVKQLHPELFHNKNIWVLGSKKRIPSLIHDWGSFVHGFLTIDPLDFNWLHALGTHERKNITSAKYSLVNSLEKKPTLEKITSFLSQHNFNSQIARKIVDTADELIMNAFFDAPQNEQSEQIYHQLNRSELVLAPKDQFVEVNISLDELNVLKLSVKDPHGTLKKDTLLAHLGQDYDTEAYLPRSDYAGAGLGLWSAVKSGASVSFIVNERQSTEVIAYFPHTDSFLEYRKNSQLVAFDFKKSA